MDGGNLAPPYTGMYYIMGTFLGAPTVRPIRTIVLGGLYLGPPVQGNSHIDSIIRMLIAVLRGFLGLCKISRIHQMGLIDE